MHPIILTKTPVDHDADRRTYGHAPLHGAGQAKGERASIASDLYSLGVVLYQMLTGQVLFDAETPWEVIRQHIEAQPAR